MSKILKLADIVMAVTVALPSTGREKSLQIGADN
jgi:hypothetical protein